MEVVSNLGSVWCDHVENSPVGRAHIECGIADFLFPIGREAVKETGNLNIATAWNNINGLVVGYIA